MNQQKNMHNIFTAWGRSHQELPSRNDELKKTLLEGLSVNLSEVQPKIRRMPWPSLVLAGLAVVILFASSLFANSSAPAGEFLRSTALKISPASPGAGLLQQGLSDSDYYTPPQDGLGGIPANDTREFLKTYYYATIRTRRVEELTQRLQTTIRGLGGRVDSSNSSSRRGFVSFVLPADKFDAFRSEIRGFMPARFFDENTQTENLLAQKQSVEAQRAEAEKAMAQFQNDRKGIIAEHGKTLASLQSRLKNTAGELATDGLTEERQQELLREQGVINSQIARENASYSQRLSSLDVSIKNNETYLENINKQDQSILDTVATVRGTVSLNWIGVWEVIDLYIPLYWIAIIFAAAAVVSYMLHRRWRS